MSFARIKFIPRGIGLRFSLWFAVLFAGCSVLCLVLAYLFAAESMRKNDQTRILAKFSELSALVHGTDVSELEAKIKAEANGDESEYFVRLSDGDGKQLYIDTAFDDLEEFTHIPPPGSGGMHFANGFWNEILSIEGDEYLELYTAKLPSGLWLEVGASSEDREDILSSFRDQLPWIALGLLIGGMVCGLFFTNRALTPIRDLISTVSRIKSGNISARVKTSGSHDEIDMLKQLFNEMLDHVQLLIEGMRRTTDGLAHDIRTPITRLRTNAELALSKGQSEDDYKEALITAIENSEQIIELVNVLMDVSEAEAKSLALNPKRFSVNELISSVIDLYEYTADDKNIRVIRDDAPGADLFIEADLVQMRRALANLLDNAIKYSPADSEVCVRTRIHDDSVRISVIDAGPGIPENELTHIWSRLFRGDQSRSTRGMGLGLSLVKAIAEMQGGRVGVHSHVGKGSEFFIEMKLSGKI